MSTNELQRLTALFTLIGTVTWAIAMVKKATQ